MEIIFEVILSECIIVGMINFFVDLKFVGVVYSYGEGYVRIWIMLGKEWLEVS